MKTILIIYPHWVPSNLAGVHRPRLIANFLPELGWHPLVLTASPEFYEEEPDPDIAKTVSDKVEVIYTKAYKVTKPRVIGDIGLRAFPFLFRRALKILKERKIDFIWIPIPSFYTALLGRLLFQKTGTPYGIDYIDPWVRDISTRRNFRSVLSQYVARVLEPIALKHAALISGVSTSYYEPVLQRNPKIRLIANIGMPYGFDPNDHKIKINDITLPWAGDKKTEPIVYAGAFLPNSHLFIDALFGAVKSLRDQCIWDDNKKFYFLGTGYYHGVTIADKAKSYGLEDIVYESRGRFPYLHILNFLNTAFAILVVGSTEKHYTASKIFQAILSKKPVLAIFHAESTVVSILEECNATGLLTKYLHSETLQQLEENIGAKLKKLLSNNCNWNPSFSKISNYSAKESAKVLLGKVNSILV
ncbi:hypothetical protein ACSX1A_07565 [Pontibacter sp. MBLB2868]|uniref:hypothetical protein n=1 Tax=Pontibacter sp. MBLB2868 TaxID=3451555 RepID=UPI003F753FE3